MASALVMLAVIVVPVWELVRAVVAVLQSHVMATWARVAVQELHLAAAVFHANLRVVRVPEVVVAAAVLIAVVRVAADPTVVAHAAADPTVVVHAAVARQAVATVVAAVQEAVAMVDLQVVADVVTNRPSFLTHV